MRFYPLNPLRRLFLGNYLSWREGEARWPEGECRTYTSSYLAGRYLGRWAKPVLKLVAAHVRAFRQEVQ